MDKRTLFAFALVSVPLATGGLPLVLYLTPYYAAVSGMSIATIGAILGLARIADVFMDPLIGAASDRTPPRYGRRGLWLALGAPVMAIATLATFSPFSTPGPLYLFCACGALYLGWTLLSIPLAAWAAELSDDYHERSRLTAARTWGGIVGSLLAILAPLLLSVLAASGMTAAAPSAPGSLQPMLTVLAWLTAALLLVAVPWLLWQVPQSAYARRGDLAWLPGLKLMFSSRAFRRLLLSNVSAAIGWNSVNVLFMFFVTQYLGAGDQQWPLIILAYLLGQLCGTPLIVRFAPRFSKHRMLAVCSLISVALFSLVLLLGPGDYLAYAAINFVTGLFAPSLTILGPSMAADIIDEDHLASGQQRAALFMALWAMTEKLAVALAAVIALALAEFMGFNPATPHDATSLMALKLSFCAVPNLFFLVSIALIWHYPLGPDEASRNRAALAVRAS
jgi:GPH family glycoside/pentoside/hexuronide:cation symporter